MSVAWIQRWLREKVLSCRSVYVGALLPCYLDALSGAISLECCLLGVWAWNPPQILQCTSCESNTDAVERALAGQMLYRSGAEY
jgi:hypothetical protein